MDSKRLEQQIRFLLEVDKLKSVYRRTYLIHEERHENDAEHSWHLALYVILLREYANEDEIDILKALEMVLIHDLVEIIAGDTFIYDEEGKLNQAEREREAAEKLFSELPEDQREHFSELFGEFEAASIPEARFAKSLDRLQPLLHNYHTAGKAWKEHGVTPERVDAVNASIADGSQVLSEYAKAIIQKAADNGFFRLA